MEKKPLRGGAPHRRSFSECLARVVEELRVAHDHEVQELAHRLEAARSSLDRQVSEDDIPGAVVDQKEFRDRPPSSGGWTDEEAEHDKRAPSICLVSPAGLRDDDMFTKRTSPDEAVCCTVDMQYGSVVPKFTPAGIEEQIPLIPVMPDDDLDSEMSLEVNPVEFESNSSGRRPPTSDATRPSIVLVSEGEEFAPKMLMGFGPSPNQSTRLSHSAGADQRNSGVLLDNRSSAISTVSNRSKRSTRVVSDKPGKVAFEDEGNEKEHDDEEPSMKKALSLRFGKKESGRFDVGEDTTYLVLPKWEEALNGMLSRGRAQSVKDLFHTDGDEASRSMRDRDSCQVDGGCGRYVSYFMIHPTSLKFLSFAVLGLILIALDCVVVPLEVFEPEQGPFLDVTSWISRSYWTLNLGMSCITCYLRDDGTFETRPSFVIRNYLKTWFSIDVIVVLLDWVDYVVGLRTEGVQRVGTFFRSLRLIRTVRLTRVLRAPELTKAFSEYIPATEQFSLIVTIAIIMGVFLWFTHVVACLWYVIGMLGDQSGTTSWIDSGEYAGLRDSSLGYRYTVSFFWSMATFSGETGVVMPTNLGERVFATSILFVAFVVSASYVGRITTSMTRLQIIASEHSSKLAILRRFLLDHQISRPLAVRVQRNATHAMLEQKSKALESSVEVLQLISTPVLAELHFEIHFQTLENHPFFMVYCDINQAGIRKVCHQAIQMLSLHSKDILFSAMESTQKMYFIVNGTVSYMQEKKQIKTVEKGMWMSEPSLWTSWQHCGTCRARSEVRLLVIDAEEFVSIVSKFPSEHAGLYAMEYIEWLNGKKSDESMGRKFKHSDIDIGQKEVNEIIANSFPEEESSDGSDSSDESDTDVMSSTRSESMTPVPLQKEVPPDGPRQSTAGGLLDLHRISGFVASTASRLSNSTQVSRASKTSRASRMSRKSASNSTIGFDDRRASKMSRLSRKSMSSSSVDVKSKEHTTAREWNEVKRKNRRFHRLRLCAEIICHKLKKLWLWKRCMKAIRRLLHKKTVNRRHRDSAVTSSASVPRKVNSSSSSSGAATPPTSSEQSGERDSHSPIWLSGSSPPSGPISPSSVVPGTSCE